MKMGDADSRLQGGEFGREPAPARAAESSRAARRLGGRQKKGGAPPGAHRLRPYPRKDRLRN